MPSSTGGVGEEEQGESAEASELARLKQPTLYIYGTNDPESTVDRVRHVKVRVAEGLPPETAEEIPEQVITITRGGHSPQRTHPEATVLAILRALA